MRYGKIRKPRTRRPDEISQAEIRLPSTETTSPRVRFPSPLVRTPSPPPQPPSMGQEEDGQLQEEESRPNSSSALPDNKQRLTRALTSNGPHIMSAVRARLPFGCQPPFRNSPFSSFLLHSPAFSYLLLPSPPTFYFLTYLHLCSSPFPARHSRLPSLSLPTLLSTTALGCITTPCQLSSQPLLSPPLAVPFVLATVLAPRIGGGQSLPLVLPLLLT